jgi:uncharacterized protein (TIGR02145 family)
MDNFLNDIDGNKYATVQIGNQIWLAENLKVTHFKNGDAIPLIEDDKAWEKAGNENSPAVCFFLNNPAHEKTYGKLYNWSAVVDSRGLAPEGWHIPSEAEWNELETFIVKRGAGEKLKSTDGWYRKKNGTNESGFNGLPGADRSWNGCSDGDELKRFGTWYSSNADKFAGVTLNWDASYLVYSSMTAGGMGHYVRCIKNI